MFRRQFIPILLMLVALPLIVIAVSAQTDSTILLTTPQATPNEGQAGLETLSAEIVETLVTDLTVTSDPCYIDPDAEYIPYCTWTPTPSMTPTPTPQPTEETLPVEGLYAYRFEPRTQSGDCSDYLGGDNDGPSREYSAEDPMFQASVCKWTEQGIVLVDHETYRWDGSLYVGGTSIDTYSNTTMSRVLSVIDASNFDVILTSQSGTCTNTHIIHYELVQPGRMFGCYTSIPTQEPQATGVPNDEPTIEPPIVEEGHYVVSWLPIDFSCDQSLAPTFTEAGLKTAGKDTIRLLVNGQVVELSGDFLSGEYTIFEETLYATLSRRFPKDFNISWQAYSEDKSQSCYQQGTMTWVSELTEAELAELNSGGNPETGEAEVAGNFAVTWEPVMEICSQEMVEKLPNFAQAGVSMGDNSVIISGDGFSYTLENTGGIYFYWSTEGDTTITFNIDKIKPDEITAVYALTIGDQSCFASLTLAMQ
jgi:hypothetical protein